MTKRFTLRANIYPLAVWLSGLCLVPGVLCLVGVAKEGTPVGDFIGSAQIGALNVLIGLALVSIWAIADAVGLKNRPYIREAVQSLALAALGFVAVFVLMVIVSVSLHGMFPY